MVFIPVQKRHQSSILYLLRDARPRTRLEIARATGLSPTTVGRALQGLVRQGILEAFDSHHGTVGRPASKVRLNPEL
ncbi:MAG: helix-turn-helix domain-containing protein, partial [Anaerolineae bacterium]